MKTILSELYVLNNLVPVNLWLTIQAPIIPKFNQNWILMIVNLDMMTIIWFIIHMLNMKENVRKFEILPHALHFKSFYLVLLALVNVVVLKVSFRIMMKMAL